MSNLIWNSTLDSIYDCEVTRIDERTGLLKVINSESKSVLLEKTVGLSYGSIFGPDVEDVAIWQELAVKAVDSQ